MSILDSNIVEQLNHTGVSSLQKNAAQKEPLITEYPLDLLEDTKFTQFILPERVMFISKWLHDHMHHPRPHINTRPLYDYANCYELGRSLKDKLKTEVSIPEFSGMVYILRNIHDILPTATEGHVNICPEMVSVSQVYPDISVKKLSISLTWNTYRPFGAELLLDNVEDIPQEIAWKDDAGYYHWFCPVEKIHITDSPNLNDDIKKLAYVDYIS